MNANDVKGCPFCGSRRVKKSIEVPNEFRNVYFLLKFFCNPFIQTKGATGYYQHELFFSLMSLRMLVERSNFACLRITTPERNKSEMLMRKLLERFAVLFGMGSCIDVIARKITGDCENV